MVWNDSQSSTVVCMVENCTSVPALYDTSGVFKQGHSCQHTLIISCGAWEARSANAEPTCSPILYHTVPQPWPPGGNTPDCRAATDSMCPWIYDGDLLAAFHVKSHLEFPSLAVCVASVNPLTFRADTYRSWLSASPEPWLSLTHRWPQHSPASATSYSQPRHNTAP